MPSLLLAWSWVLVKPTVILYWATLEPYPFSPGATEVFGHALLFVPPVRRPGPPVREGRTWARGERKPWLLLFYALELAGAVWQAATAQI